ncbi:MAG TPA: CoA-binding protein, partial [bacterium]|nr:CoA-binding protein [bacterium]
MKDILDLLREPQVTIAVVGANNNPNKYGNTIYRDLRRKGYTIFPVNPSATEVV